MVDFKNFVRRIVVMDSIPTSVKEEALELLLQDEHQVKKQEWVPYRRYYPSNASGREMIMIPSGMNRIEMPVCFALDIKNAIGENRKLDAIRIVRNCGRFWDHEGFDIGLKDAKDIVETVNWNILP